MKCRFFINCLGHVPARALDSSARLGLGSRKLIAGPRKRGANVETKRRERAMPPWNESAFYDSAANKQAMDAQDQSGPSKCGSVQLYKVFFSAIPNCICEPNQRDKRVHYPIDLGMVGGEASTRSTRQLQPAGRLTCFSRTAFGSPIVAGWAFGIIREC